MSRQEQRGNSPLNDFSTTIGDLKAALGALAIADGLIGSTQGVAKSFEHTAFPALQDPATLPANLDSTLSRVRNGTYPRALTDKAVQNALNLNGHAQNIRMAMTHLEEAQSLLNRLNYEVVLARSSVASMDKNHQAEIQRLESENARQQRELAKKDMEIEKLQRQIAALTQPKEEALSTQGRVSRVLSGFSGLFTRTTSATPTSSPAGTPRTTLTSTPDKLPRSAM